MRKYGGLMLFALMHVVALLSQDVSFKVMISNDQLHPGDTLDLAATYKVGARQLPPATFALTILGPNEKSWQLRWPMINGQSEASIVLPDSLPLGPYNLLFAVQPRFLRLYGQVVYPAKPGKFYAVFGRGSLAKTVEIKTAPDGKFVIDDIYFEDLINVSFQHSNNKEPAPPIVKLDAWLDADFEPAATRVKQVAVNAKGQNDFVPGRLSNDSLFANGFSYFQTTFAIQQRMVKYPGLKNMELYDSLFLPAMFKVPATRVFDCFSDSPFTALPSAYDLLKTEMKEPAVQTWGDFNPIAENPSPFLQKIAQESMVFWNNKWYRIYSNGQYGDPTPLTYPPNAFASIKIFDPPFMKVPNSKYTLGTIAFFEKRYPFENPFPYNHQFQINGYTPAVFYLPLQ